MDQELVAILSGAKYLPVDGLRRAVRDPEAVAGPVLAVVERAVADPDALDGEEADLLFWGMHALGAARDTRLCAPLLRLLRQDADALDGLLGDAVPRTVARILAGVFDGDAAPFHALILDSSIDGFVRGEVQAALSFLTREGRVPLAETRDLLVRFDDKKAAVEEDVAWSGWEEAIAYLGLLDLVPRVEAARRDGRLTDEFSDAAWFRKTLRQVTAEPPDFSEFSPERYGTLDDPVAALTWTAERYGLPVINLFKSIGRNDPCPCGSGKKFKKCCLSRTAAPPVTPPGLR